MTPNKWLLTGAGVVAAITTIVTQGETLAHRYGWRSAASVDAAIAEVQAAAEEQYKSLEDLLRCGNYDEELNMLLRAQRNGDDSVETEERIRRLRELRRNRNCSRFDE